MLMLYPTNMVLKSLITHENYFSLEALKLIGTLIKFIEHSNIVNKVVDVEQMCSFIDFCLIRIKMDHVLAIQYLDMLDNKGSHSVHNKFVLAHWLTEGP